MTNTPDLPAPLAGNLDVPPSVWAGSHRVEEQLPEGLIAVYTRPQGLILDTTGTALLPAITAGRRCIAFVPTDPTTLLDTTEQRALGQIRLVDPDDLPTAVSAYTDEADLVIATSDAAHSPGWWPAVRGALRTGGHLAVMCATPDSHAGIVTGAAAVGLAFTQHLVTVSGAVLDEAVTTEANLNDRKRRRRAHTRSHRDVYVFANPRRPV
ncbi:hypothetical protein [Phytomonospora endophytica]|uniref:Uncharacterized protein n=1 Tax=Phytomonospora endophytica TaxID=714109 RepID=A0A841FRV0_9ACTN|nr:hypothetical protein [Phytomonospora endophytica]MBB6038524.1 hypothetical protein [Phytomonospora endophytica]GIG69337.1 hypothetical protein Pen01_56320 [Phytomonospora endophytica]